MESFYLQHCFTYIYPEGMEIKNKIKLKREVYNSTTTYLSWKIMQEYIGSFHFILSF
jgi:hypothetical protein